MNKGILYILLLSYSTLMLKPVLPYISDGVAHIFWYSEHMATVHYVNGKFHVHNAIMEEEKKNGTDKNPYALKKEQSQNDHLISALKGAECIKLPGHCWYMMLPANLPHAELKNDYPPPKQSPHSFRI